jgi:hypothetical protein
LQHRVSNLEEQVSASEDALERLVEAATTQKLSASEDALKRLVEAETTQKQAAAISRTAPVSSIPSVLADHPHQAHLTSNQNNQNESRKIVDPSYSAPGFIGHSVLSMNETQFRDTPVDVLMSQYGQSGGGGTCDGDFGMGLIERWRNSGTEYCTARSPTSSSIKCHLVKQTRHHGDGDQLCVGRNVRLNLKDFASTPTTDAILEQYISSKHSSQPYIKYSHGAFAGTCDLNQELWQKRNFPGWNLDWKEAFTPLPGSSTSELECDAWIEEPTLLVQRDTFANFFHDSEDFVNVFIALAVLQWSTKDLQLIVADLYPKGPFYDIWEKVFAGRHTPLTAWDLKTKYGAKNLCFRKLAVGIYGPASPITVASWRTPCVHTPLVRSYADYVLRGLGLQLQTHYAQHVPSKTVMVTWMARRASSQWPERRFCDSKNSFFKCEQWAHLDKRSLGRMIKNDQEVRRAIVSSFIVVLFPITSVT